MDNNKVNNKEWPIAPTFLSLRQGCNEDSANYNIDGLYNPFYIRGFLADLSQNEDIQNAVSLFQFVPNEFFPHDPKNKIPNTIPTNPRKGTVILNKELVSKTKEILNEQGKKIIRIDSGTYVNNGRLCDIFRKCKGTEFCFLQDSIVGIFANKELNRLDRTGPKYLNTLKQLITDFNEDRCNEIEKIKYEPFDGQKRFCLHYTCRHSLFEEHIFPIYLQGRVIACLMLGQMGRDNFNKEASFSEHRDNMYNENSNTLKYFDDIKKLNKEEWEKKAKAVIEHIEIFEKQLEEKIEYRNNSYINSIFSDIEDKFRDKVKAINIKEQKAVEQFTKALDEAFDAIRDAFDKGNDSFIRMFALPIDTEHDKLVPIGWSGAEFDAQEDFSFSLKHLKSLYNSDSKQPKDIIKKAASSKIKNIFNDEKDVLLPGWLAGKEVAYIVWKRHSDELKKLKNRKTFENYKKALRKFYSVALECYSYIRGTKMELLLETTIQESAHESAHFILPAIDVVENHLEVIPKEIVLPKFSKRYDNYINNFEKCKDEILESLNQLREINNGSPLIFSSELQISKNLVPVFNLLYKLKKILNKRALDSHKNIHYYQSEHFITANIDAKYLNHALYNLLDNAIKYGYDGSNIYIRVYTKEDILNIEVISYGFQIQKDDKIYQLFGRSVEAAKMAGGTGIGLYIVKKICEAHGGTITHKSEKLSDYNIPILFNYKYRNILANKNSAGEIDMFEKEISKIPDSIEYEVVFDHRFISYALVFSTRIKEPTYRNTFSITIPLN